MKRRAFVVRAAGALAVGVAVDRLGGQSTTAQPQVGNASNLGAMDQGAAQSVRRPAKPGAHPSMTDAQRDELEHHIRCQCGCTLDVYICRTTDFSCVVSPAMHADIKSLVEGGYSAQEILDSFVDTYGERALMAPRARGFNLLGYVAPVRRPRRRGDRRRRGAPRLGESRARGRGRAGDSRNSRRAGASRRRDPRRRMIGALVLGTILAVAVLAFVLAPVVTGVRRGSTARAPAPGAVT